MDHVTDAHYLVKSFRVIKGNLVIVSGRHCIIIHHLGGFSIPREKEKVKDWEEEEEDCDAGTFG